MIIGSKSFGILLSAAGKNNQKHYNIMEISHISPIMEIKLNKLFKKV